MCYNINVARKLAYNIKVDTFDTSMLDVFQNGFASNSKRLDVFLI